MATFPSTLPAPLMSGYELKPGEAVARTQMEQGSARARQRARTAPTSIPISWELTVPQMATFEAWHRLTIHNGADWFTINLLNGLGMTSCSARFMGMWTAKQSGPANWVVSATLEIADRPMLTLAQLTPYL